MLNTYRLIGDGSHVVATWIILLKFVNTRSASGFSGKAQLLLALTYTFRYLDLLTNYVSEYNTILKVYYITTSWLACYCIFCAGFTGKTYQKDKDSFRIEYLILIVTVLAFFINHDMAPLEVAWTWSIYMEAVALIPQFYMTWITKKVDGYLGLYVLGMACYRGFYIGNWVYRYYNEDYYDPIAIISGCVETFVGVFGLLTMFTIVLGKPCNSERSGESSIYVLPSVAEHFGKDYKILRNNAATAESLKDANIAETNKFEKYLDGA